MMENAVVMQSPLVSVVMPSMNQPAFIDAAITSVLSQDYPNIELIVADGGSRADTLDILSRRRRQDGRLRYFSRPDRGPAHALNDAMDAVRGTVIGWLNSDDMYAPGAISRAMAVLAEQPRLLMVYGQGQHIDGKDQPIGDYPTLPPSTPASRFKEGCFICQPTMFLRRSARILMGKLDEGLKASFDFEYWLRAFTAFPERIGFVDQVQAYSRLHDDCITMRMRRTVALEGMRVLARHLGSAPKEWLLTYTDELLAQDPVERGVDDVEAHLREAASLAAAWMTDKEQTELETALTRRLYGK
ncbi:glycosyltransferase [Massilia alkalitolerans]|uniref:glycosyltransferase n=1 Tax=Massilia alkalitolerans TaxID=286638 RepID=UPI0028AFE174|nr:glycosyltransferase [Massilia alkalitolerans]